MLRSLWNLRPMACRDRMSGAWLGTVALQINIMDSRPGHQFGEGGTCSLLLPLIAVTFERQKTDVWYKIGAEWQ